MHTTAVARAASARRRHCATIDPLLLRCRGAYSEPASRLGCAPGLHINSRFFARLRHNPCAKLLGNRGEGLLRHVLAVLPNTAVARGHCRGPYSLGDVGAPCGWHVSKELVVPTNLTLIHLPPYSPELNPVERVWEHLRDRWLSHRVLAGGYEAVVDAACAAWNALLAEPGRLRSLTSFTWLPASVTNS